MAYATQTRKGEELNRIYPDDLPVHRWYRFVLSYPPHIVRDYIDQFGLTQDHRVLDPFCGTGTTVVECKKQGIPSVGFESNPVVQFAARVKTSWDVDPDALEAHAGMVADAANGLLCEEGVEDEPFFAPPNEAPRRLRTLDDERARLLIKGSISPKPLHKVLALQEKLGEMHCEVLTDHERLALAKQLVHTISNLRFGPEVGAGKAKEDAPAIRPWLESIQEMTADLRAVRDQRHTFTDVWRIDSRNLAGKLKPASIDAVITSPPYPNEKDYSRTTRLESVLLGFMSNRKDLREHKKRLLRSNTRGVYVTDDDDQHIEAFPRVKQLADQIEVRRRELNKTSGFEKLYHRVVRLYFGGMAQHLKTLRPALRPGAQLAYVVGDQASYFRIPIRTGQILAEIAEGLGYEVSGLDLFRTRFSTTTQEELREEVLLLKWNPRN